MKTLNVAVIGFGFMGKTHTYGYKTIPLSASIRIALLADTEKASAKASMRAKNGVIKIIASDKQTNRFIFIPRIVIYKKYIAERGIICYSVTSAASISSSLTISKSSVFFSSFFLKTFLTLPTSSGQRSIRVTICSRGSFADAGA